MSFSNDEEGDGLATLFGSITPEAAPQGDPGPRRAAPAPAATETGAPVSPAPAAAYPPAASAPAAYAPAAYASPSYAPPAYAPPASPAYDAYEMPAPAPHVPPSYDLPAPAATQYPGLAPSAPAYPPTTQYPAGLNPASPHPTAPPQASAPSSSLSGYAPPAYAPLPAYPPAAEVPVYAPPVGPTYNLPAAPPTQPAPPAEPPYGAAPSSYESFAGSPALAEPPRAPNPVESPVAEHPLVLSEPAVPATVFPPGPLLPSSTAAVETPEDLERSTTGEKVALVLAVLTGPIGLAIAIGNAVRSARRRGWLIGVVRASLVLGVLSTIAAGIAGYIYWNVRSGQIQHAEIAAAISEFCSAAEADPSMVTPPTLGWPAQGASVGESLTLMQAWADRWTTLAATSPAELRAGMELLAEKGQTIIDAVTESRIVDDAANQTQIASAEAQSGVANWYTTYCLEP